MDLVLEGGNVRTLDPERSPAQDALALRAGVVAERAAADARRVNLGGRCVLPGFADAHVHFPTWSLGLHQARLEGVRTRDEALERVEAALARVPAGGWLRGLGWREGDWPDPPERGADGADVEGLPLSVGEQRRT